MTKKTTPTVEVGQVWDDNDPRSIGRQVEVISIDETHATVGVITERGGGARPSAPRLTRIRLNRFRPTRTGYRLTTESDR